MDLNTVEAVLRPRMRSELPPSASGDSFLAGGTWLFSEPQPALRRLVDLSALRWESLRRTETALHVAATCTFAELEAFEAPVDWIAAELITSCCHALLGSFKIRGVATVGGNLCLGLAAGPMVALATALDWLMFRDLPDFRSGRRKLDAWFSAFLERPSMRATPLSGDTQDAPS